MEMPMVESAHMASVTESAELRTHYVYRLYSEENDLLYVGVTSNFTSRFLQHHQKTWWPEVNQWKITKAPNRITGLYLEAEAILTEHPKHNVDIPSWASYRSLRSRALPEFKVTPEDRMMRLEAENARLRQQIRALTAQPRKAPQSALPVSGDEISADHMAAVLVGLSPKDVAFLRAMSVDDGPSSTMDLRSRVGGSTSLISNYRLRLMNAGLVHKVGFAQIDLSVPGLREFLREPIPESA